MCLGFNQYIPSIYGGVTADVMHASIENAKATVAKLSEEATKLLEKTAANWSLEKMIAQYGGSIAPIAQAARFHDLVVLPQPYGSDNANEAISVLETALFEGSAPVLVYPREKVSLSTETIVVAWNESKEALNAVKAALPFLKQANKVNICLVEPERHSDKEADPGAALGQFISRHGVNVEISILPRTMHKIADVLNRHCNDLKADMLVMGAYGHSRFRESILGGATRNMLEDVSLPILMAH